MPRASTAGAEHPLSWLTAALCVLVLVRIIWRLARRQKPAAWPVIGCGLLLALASAFMITRPSLPVWRALEPILAQLQYPWRFLTLTAVGAMIAVGGLPLLLSGRTSRPPFVTNEVPPEPHGPSLPEGSILSGVAALFRPRSRRVRSDLQPRPHPSTSVSALMPASAQDAQAFIFSGDRRRLSLTASLLLGLLIVALLLQPLPNLPAQPLALAAADTWAPDRMWREDAEAGQVGATWTGEFLPVTVAEQRWALGRPREGAQDGAPLSSRPAVQITRMRYDRVELALETAAPLTVRLHQFYLPAWQTMVNNARMPTYPTGELGLVSADLPAGASRFAFRFGPTPAWIAGGLLALLVAVVWAFMAWRSKPPRRRLRGAAVALVILAAVLGLNSLGIGGRGGHPRRCSRPWATWPC